MSTLLLAGCALTTNPPWSGTSSAEPAPQRPKTVADLTKPGNCRPEFERIARQRGDLNGPLCWDPPGERSAMEPVSVIAGRRRVEPNVYWFDMPKEAKVDHKTGCVRIGETERTSAVMYTPYFDGEGLPPFKLPDFAGKTESQALDMIDALNLPACVKIEYGDFCDRPHGVVCKSDDAPGSDVDSSGGFRLLVVSDFKDQGTPNETRRLRDFTGKPTEQAREALAKVFTTVEIEETDMPCERGLVCEIQPGVDGFYPKDQKITLKVRRGKR